MSIIRCARHEQDARLQANVYNLGSGESFENFKTRILRSILVSERVKVMNERISLRV